MKILAGLLLTLSVAVPAEESCPAGAAIDESAIVSYVYDGDTVKLADGRSLRIVGIDTPEIGRDGRPSQPYAEAARRTLLELLEPSSQVHLQYDAERRDRHGRQLAHLFIDDGTNAGRKLLEAGLATALVIPPNLRQHECYAAAESRAREQGHGLWRLDAYRSVAAAKLPRGARGFRIVRGTVQRVGNSQDNLWLDLTPRFALRILKDDLRYFAAYSPGDLQGHTVEARGWIQRRRGRMRMRIRHEAALTVLD